MYPPKKFLSKGVLILAIQPIFLVLQIFQELWISQISPILPIQLILLFPTSCDYVNILNFKTLIISPFIQFIPFDTCIKI